MIKALLLSIGVAILFFGANYLELLSFLASGTFFWLAVIFLIVMIIITIFVLGIPVGGENKDDEKGD